jgi:RNA polymerase subunit RPABC4/transcription elongation factor Spt4
MAKEKVCRTCKIIVEGELCPICKKAAFSNNFNGRIVILDAKRSTIAKENNINHNGEYAIKVK